MRDEIDFTEKWNRSRANKNSISRKFFFKAFQTHLVGEVQVKMVPVTPQKNVRLKVEQMKAHVRPVMEFAALVSLKKRIFFTEFHGTFSFFFSYFKVRSNVFRKLHLFRILWSWKWSMSVKDLQMQF